MGVGWTAAFDSATVASVGRLESGEVLSAMIMIKSIFEVVSSLLLGNVLVWYVLHALDKNWSLSEIAFIQLESCCLTSRSVGVLPNLVFFIIAVRMFYRAHGPPAFLCQFQLTYVLLSSLVGLRRAGGIYRFLYQGFGSPFRVISFS